MLNSALKMIFGTKQDRDLKLLKPILDQVNAQETKFQKLSDSLVANKYTYALAKVVNNSTHQLNNYITIDKGEKDGLKKGMSVISPSGIVGKIIKCNRHFSIVMPVLHSKMTVSAQVKRNGELGSLKWDGKRAQTAKLLDVGTHAKIKTGDTIQTSGYNATFPPRSMIGIVKKVKVIPEQTFYDIDVELSTHFSSLAFVYVIQDILKLEQEALEMELLEEISE
jgi:rod shape-determining protein MreC